MYIILDGSNIAYRAWHSSPINGFKNIPDEQSEVEQVAGLFLYAFCSQLIKIVHSVDITRPKFSKLLICWDGACSTQLRRDQFSPYKQQRKKTADPREFITPHVFIALAKKEFMTVSPLLSLEDRYAEADDIIGILCNVMSDQQKCIVSRDKDMYQLVNDNTKIFDPFENRWLGAKEVEDSFGVPPELVVEYKAVIGDSSDNYPGIAGIGPKKGLAMLHSGKNYEVSHKEVALFRKIATIPFENFCDLDFLDYLFTVGLECPPNWRAFADKWDFKNEFSLKLEGIV